jgi:cytochrome c553
MNKALLVLFFWPLILLAQDRAPANAGNGASAWNEIKGEKLETLRLKGDRDRGEEAFKICQGCHRRGATGSASGAYPRLAGQHATVLIEQIADIRSGKRLNLKMEPFSEKNVLTTQEIADIAVYLQALPIPPNLGLGPGTALDHGSKLYAKDCATCHGNKGEGDAAKFFPLVAGQHFNYLVREARLIRDGDRGNANPDMAKVIKTYGDADIDAVADYISRLTPP